MRTKCYVIQQAIFMCAQKLLNLLCEKNRKNKEDLEKIRNNKTNRNKHKFSNYPNFQGLVHKIID